MRLPFLPVALAGMLRTASIASGRSAQRALATSFSGPYKLLLHKYYVDEIYSLVIVKPLLAMSRFFLDWVVDVAILGGLAWLLGGIALLGGAILQRWQSGNLRSYAGWLAFGAAALLVFVLVPWNRCSQHRNSRGDGDALMNESILTLILLTPLTGALVVAMLPDRGKLAAWLALVTTLVTFALTLHLPAHFIQGQRGFQFEINSMWIENPPIHYHVGVDGLSLWLVVLGGLLAPVGVLASWNAIKERRKVFYSLFLVQQTAMYGVFLSLDLMVYYGFWELSLVPMAMLIAMYGRKDGPKAATKFFLFTFIPSAPLLVAILWLYAKTGTFNFADLQADIATGALPVAGLFWVALAFLFAFAVKVPVFPLHGWLADTFSEAPVALAMVIAGKLGLYSMLRFHVGLFPAQAKAVAPVLIVLTGVGVLYGACLALVQSDFWRLIAFATVGHFSLITLGIYGLTFTGRDGAIYQTLNNEMIEAALFVLLRRAGAALRDQPDCLVWWAGGEAAATGHAVCDHDAGHGRAADAEWICGRISDPVEHLHGREPQLGDGCDGGGDSGRGLHAVAGAAAVLRAGKPDGFGSHGKRFALRRTGDPVAVCRADAGDGSRAVAVDHGN